MISIKRTQKYRNMPTYDEQLTSFNNCPVCNKIANITGGDTNHNCPRCGGYFKITREARSKLDKTSFSEEERSLVSHVIRDKKLTLLTTEELDKISINYQLPNPNEQINNTIKFLAKETKYFGNYYTELANVRSLSSIMGSANKANYYAVLSEMHEQKITERVVTNLSGLTGAGGIKLTMKGWNLYEKICTSESKQIFMAMQFKKDRESESEQNFLYQRICDAAQKIGYKLIKIDDVAHCGEITKQIEIEIRRSAFVIVDLTHDNPGAYWEAGFAHGIGKKVIYICRQNEISEKKIHFDVNHYNIHPWIDSGDNTNFLNSLKAVIEVEFLLKN